MIKKRMRNVLPLVALVLVSMLISNVAAAPAFGLGLAPAGSVAAPAAQAPFVPGQIIVGLAPGASIDSVASVLEATGVRALGGGRAFVLDVSGDSPARAAQAAGLAGVRYAEPNWLRQLHEGPNDDDYGLKWDLNNGGSLCDGSDCATPDADMDWEEAYAYLGNVSGLAVIAVIDTGADLDHPDLEGKLVNGYDFLDNDSDPTDTYGHGTHVAGIAAAETNNSTGTAGVAYGANIQIMPLRVCDENGCPTSAIVEAINHAADNGANVINLSLGGRFGSASEENAINYAWGQGLVIVASSGNDGAGRVSYPAAFTNVIAVGSTNWHDQLAPYSNKGNDLDVVAPGGDMSGYHDPGGIYSTMPTYDVYLTTQYSYDKNYDQLQGTSMSAPQVSGLAALLFAQTARTNAVVRNIIETTTDDLGKAGWDRDYGWGRINICKAVGGTDCDGTPPPPNDPPNVTIISPANASIFGSGAEILFEGTASDTEDGGLTASLVWTSNIYGQIGTGGSFSTTTLGDGNHTITASVTDSGGKTGSASINITVGDPPAGATDVIVTSITYATEGGRDGNKHLLITIALVDDLNKAVRGALVSTDLFRDGSLVGRGTGTTTTDGKVTFTLKNAKSGWYTTTVTDVTADGLTWYGVTPANGFEK